MKIYSNNYVQHITTLGIGAFLLPIPTLAQDFGWLLGLVANTAYLFQTIVPVLIMVAVALFIWGLVLFIFSSGDEKKLDEGKQRMMWGVIALFFIVTIWGLVALLQQLTGVYPTEDAIMQAPQAIFK
jgi:hypothetical protein